MTWAAFITTTPKELLVWKLIVGEEICWFTFFKGTVQLRKFGFFGSRVRVNFIFWRNIHWWKMFVKMRKRKSHFYLFDSKKVKDHFPKKMGRFRPTRKLSKIFVN
jgi:hypothetical protein